MGSAAAPLTRDRLLPPCMVKAPATYTHAATGSAHTHTHTDIFKSASFLFNKPISSFSKVYSLLGCSRIHPSFFGVTVATISAPFFPPFIRFFPSLRSSTSSATKKKKKIDCSVPFDSVKASLSCARCSSDATGFYDFSVTLRDILEEEKKKECSCHFRGRHHSRAHADGRTRSTTIPKYASNKPVRSESKTERKPRQSCGRGAARSQPAAPAALRAALAAPAPLFPRC